MSFWGNHQIDRLWRNICIHEGETFYTVRKIGYRYTVKDNYILINNDPRRRIAKTHFEKALQIKNPSPAAINREGIWGPSYVYGIITDSRMQ